MSPRINTTTINTTTDTTTKAPQTKTQCAIRRDQPLTFKLDRFARKSLNDIDKNSLPFINKIHAVTGFIATKVFTYGSPAAKNLEDILAMGPDLFVYSLSTQYQALKTITNPDPFSLNCGEQEQ